MTQAQNPQQVDPRMIEQTRKHINRLREEVARLAETDIGPTEFFGEFLTRVLSALAAPAGAVWVRTPHGNLQLQCQVRMQQVGLDKTEAGKEAHGELLRAAVQQAKPLNLPPHYSAGESHGKGPAPGNPTDYLLLLVPVMMGNQVSALIEVWQDPARHPSAVQGFLQFMVHMAELASRYMRNRLLGDMLGQQELWTKMELFARQIHESLNPVEVAYRIANEGRRLVDCDRVSVGIRYGKKVVVDAVSGADVVEKRSNLVQRQRALFDRVLTWGEKLVYTGTKDDSLPPDVLKALDAYLEESNSKMLCVLPLHDERETSEETKTRKPPRSVLMVECFETAGSPDQLIARQEVLGRHAASALYNAVEHRRIPMRFLWMPLAKLQEGLGGKTRAIVYSVLAGLLVLAGVLWFVPYPLKMDSSGPLVPEDRPYVFSPLPSTLVRFNVDAGQEVGEDENLILLYSRELQIQLERLEAEIRGNERQIENMTAQLTNAQAQNDKSQLYGEIDRVRSVLDAKVRERKAWMDSTNSVAGQPGYFWKRSPKFPHDGTGRDPDARWTIINYGFHERLTDAEVKPSDPLLRLGYLQGPWEVLLKIPQKHIGQVLQAFDRLDAAQRARLGDLLNRAVTQEWVSKLSLADWLDKGDLLDVLKRTKAVDQSLTRADLDRTSRVQLSEHLNRVPVADLVRPIRIADLQKRVEGLGILAKAVDAGWLTKNEADELLKESVLDVDLLVKSAPTETYKGKLTRSRLAGAADQNRDENGESEPIVPARVRIAGDDIAPADRIPANLLVTDTQVNAKVRCGNHRMGYSLFYGVWEFFYEKVVFFF